MRGAIFIIRLTNNPFYTTRVHHHAYQHTRRPPAPPRPCLPAPARIIAPAPSIHPATRPPALPWSRRQGIPVNPTPTFIAAWQRMALTINPDKYHGAVAKSYAFWLETALQTESITPIHHAAYYGNNLFSESWYLIGRAERCSAVRAAASAAASDGALTPEAVKATATATATATASTPLPSSAENWVGGYLKTCISRR